VRSFATVFRGAQADIEHVRQFSPLPETADELCEIARRPRVPRTARFCSGPVATETELKDLSEQGRAWPTTPSCTSPPASCRGQLSLAWVLTPPGKGTSEPPRRCLADAREERFMEHGLRKVGIRLQLHL
jgi:hypothetical protein